MPRTSTVKHSLREAEVPGPASEATIRVAEERLGVVFPEEYRAFLGNWGAAMGPGFEIAGLFHHHPDEMPLWKDVTAATLAMRGADGKIGSYADLVAIADDGMSTTFYLRCGREDRGRILALGPGVEKCVADSFDEFVAQLVSGVMPLN